jgi:hypothetical protein
MLEEVLDDVRHTYRPQHGDMAYTRIFCLLLTCLYRHDSDLTKKSPPPSYFSIYSRTDLCHQDLADTWRGHPLFAIYCIQLPPPLFEVRIKCRFGTAHPTLEPAQSALAESSNQDHTSYVRTHHQSRLPRPETGRVS